MFCLAPMLVLLLLVAYPRNFSSAVLLFLA